MGSSRSAQSTSEANFLVATRWWDLHRESALRRENRRLVYLQIVCWLGALFSGIAQAWNGRFAMNPDGISYIEVGEALFMPGRLHAINSFWPPLYPLVLGSTKTWLHPSAALEFQVVQLTNLLVYVFAMVSLNLLLRALVGSQQQADPGVVALPPWAWITLGHLVFIWTTISLNRVTLVTPDLLGMALLLLTATLFVKLRDRQRRGVDATRQGAFLLGVVVGLSYLCRLAAIGPGLAYIVLLSLPAKGRRIRLLASALAGLALLAGPYIAAISMAKGRLTLGEKGRLNYVWFVNGLEGTTHWQGGPEGSGRPVHPTRRLATDPPIYEFASPVGGTYPPSYDPSYWYEGVELTFHSMQLLNNLRFHTGPQLRQILLRAANRWVLLVLFGGGLVALLSQPWSFVRAIAPQISLMLPPLIAILMYSIVHVTDRHLGGPILLVTLGCFAAVRFPPTSRAQRLPYSLMALLGLALAALLVLPIGRNVTRAFRDLRQNRIADLSQHSQLRLARLIRAEGLNEGDAIAHIGQSSYAYWAHLARLRIVAEIPYRRGDRWKDSYARDFQRLDAEGRQEILDAMEKLDVRAVVASNLPRRESTDQRSLELPDGWKQGWKTLVREKPGLFRSSLIYEDGSLRILKFDSQTR
jgi:hypothetical protein